MKMKKQLLGFSFFIIGVSLFAQESMLVSSKHAVNYEKNDTKRPVSNLVSFEDFCNEKACTVFSSDKKFVSDGILDITVGDKVLLKETGIVLKEDKAQIFELKNQPNKFIKVESLFRLRLMYNQH